jgi:putative transposase
MQPRRRPHRLPQDRYLGRVCVAFTACEKNRRSGFAAPEVHVAFRECLERAALSHACTVPIYTLMPDHMHMLLLGDSEASRPYIAMCDFKILSGRWLHRRMPHLHWQHDFYDHVVRWSEGWRVQAKYIALNPVRSGLAADAADWPYTGAIGHPIEEILNDAFFGEF